MVDDASVLVEGHAPTPFTADEIRDGCPTGRRIEVLIRRRGESDIVQTVAFVTSDDHGADQESTVATPVGELVGEPSRSRSSWRELQGHASYPSDRTVIDTDQIALRAGRFECLRYTVTDGSNVSVYWFAVDLPGMPVKMIRTEANETTLEVTMLRNEMP